MSHGAGPRPTAWVPGVRPRRPGGPGWLFRSSSLLVRIAAAAAAIVSALLLGAPGVAAGGTGSPAGGPSEIPPASVASGPSIPAPVGPPGSTAPLLVDAHVDRSQVAPGDRITFEVELDYDAGVTVEVPEFGAAIQGLGILEQAVVPRVVEKGRATEGRRYVLSADVAGTYAIPPVTIPYRDPSGAPGEATSGQILIEVKAPADPTAGGAPAEGGGDRLHDIKPPIPPDVDWRPYAWAALLALLLAAAAWGARLAWRRRHQRPAAPPPLPHEVALRALGELERSSLLASGYQRAYAFRLSEIARAWLEGRFGFPAVESTTDEILKHLPSVPELGPRHEEQARQALSGTDLVKFADQAFPAATLEQWTRGVRSLITETLPPPEPEPEAPARRSRLGPRGWRRSPPSVGRRP